MNNDLVPWRGLALFLAAIDIRKATLFGFLYRLRSQNTLFCSLLDHDQGREAALDLQRISMVLEQIRRNPLPFQVIRGESFALYWTKICGVIVPVFTGNSEKKTL